MIPAVAIITPTFNRAHLLPRVWSSLAKQTETRFQWIVVDDGSIDDTEQVVASFSDSRICYVRQENQGVNAARNRGELELQAEYVVYLDSDDELLNQTTLTDMIAEISASRAEIAWVAFTVVNGNGKSAASHLPAPRLETGYLDHVCEQRLWGEFFPIYRRDALAISCWPPFNGLEALRHWRIVRERPVLMIDKPARIYHRQVGDNLTGASSALRRANQMAGATAQLIVEHQDAWLRHCPSQLGKYRFYRAMYLALSASGWRALPDLFAAFRYANWAVRRKALALLGTLTLPLPLRRRLFLLRAGG